MTEDSSGENQATSRRGLLRGGTMLAAAGAAVVATGGTASATLERVSSHSHRGPKDCSPDYGPLYPTKDETTGLPLLELPRGFRYVSYGWTGDQMTDGRPTPGAHDGMAAFTRKDGKLVIVRNHEQGGLTGAFVTPAYDPQADGGTTTLVFDPDKGKFLESWASLSGTIRNCAGGPTPWGTWLSCEETTNVNGEFRHGYVFEVPTSGRGDAVPLKAMGRFSHEAVAVDPRTGYVYLTEDTGRAGFYRFKPKKKGRLAEGGELEQLVVRGTKTYDTTKDDTGRQYRIAWIKVDHPDPGPDEQAVAEQGFAKGATIFARLEGAWEHEGLIYIVSTNGGPVGQGQIFEYDPREERMRLLFASPDRDLLNAPDNICVSSRGGIVLCEDGDGSEFLHGLTRGGEIFRFAENTAVIPAGGVAGKPKIPAGSYVSSEWCGATFEPRKGRWLFANLQSPGITFAITGPWDKGSL